MRTFSGRSVIGPYTAIASQWTPDAALAEWQEWLGDRLRVTDDGIEVAVNPSSAPDPAAAVWTPVEPGQWVAHPEGQPSYVAVADKSFTKTHTEVPST
jgi:hypothetical protein